MVDDRTVPEKRDTAVSKGIRGWARVMSVFGRDAWVVASGVVRGGVSLAARPTGPRFVARSAKRSPVTFVETSDITKLLSLLPPASPPGQRPPAAAQQQPVGNARFPGPTTTCAR